MAPSGGGRYEGTRDPATGFSAGRFLLPVLLWMALIFVSSSIPSEWFPPGNLWVWAKVVHVVYFGILALLARRAALHARRFPALSSHPSLTGLAVAILYGATDELHQVLTPGRNPALLDVAIDGAGAALFLALRAAFSRLNSRPPRYPVSLR